MVISDRANCIFVHIQKTGGASIERVLKEHDDSIGSPLHDGRRHMPAREIRAFVGPDKWKSCFKFAFVRNPWDRLVSWYHMCIQTPTPNRFSAYVRECAPTFEQFVTRATTGMGERTTRNQLDFVTGENGEMILDFIGRYEALHEDFSRVKVKLDLSCALPHANRSSHEDYRAYYTAETRDVVAKRFERDIRHFEHEY